MALAFQGLIALLIGGAVLVKVYWMKIKAFIFRLARGPEIESSDDSWSIPSKKSETDESTKNDPAT